MCHDHDRTDRIRRRVSEDDIAVDHRRHRRAPAARLGRRAQVLRARRMGGQDLADRKCGQRRCRISTTPRTRTRRCRCAWTPRRPVAESPAATRISPPSSCCSTPGSASPSLEPMCDAQLPQAEHVLKSTYNDWLADVWLDKHNCARPLARVDQRQRADTRAGGARSRAVGGPSLHGPGADDTADPRNPVRQPAFRSALRGRGAQRVAGGHAPDGSDAVRVDSALPGRQPRALARLLRVLAAAVRLAPDEPGVRRRLRSASRPAGGVHRGRLHLGDAGDVADGSDLGSPPR